MDYTEIELYGKTLRYFSEHHIEFEFQNVKDNWKKMVIENTNYGYKRISFRSNGKQNQIQLHRLTFFIHNPSWNIYDGSIDNSIDHIDGDKLNNNIENLRCVTHQENQWNQTKAKGYTWHKQKKKWQAQIKVDGKKIYLGLFDIEENARSAYLEGKIKYHRIEAKVFE